MGIHAPVPKPAPMTPPPTVRTAPAHPPRSGRLLATLVLASLMAAASALRAAEGAPDAVSVPRFTHPGAGQVFYFLLTDRFANGSTANDTGGIAGGPDASGFDPTRISHYHGGDFIGLTSKLDYIKGLGVTAIWITPPFVNKPMQEGTAGYHGYWILDFTRIDPHLGTEAEFREFVAQAHARGLRVYLDIVVNHTADVIKYRDGTTNYIDMAKPPYRDADGRPFDPHEVAYNGVNSARISRGCPPSGAFRTCRSCPGRGACQGARVAQRRHPLPQPGQQHLQGRELAASATSVGLDDVFTENPTSSTGS